MKLRLSLLALLFALVTGTALAHGNKVHVRGTVEKISADSGGVTTGDAKHVEVNFAAYPVFLSRSNNEDKPAKAADLAPGDLVVIHAPPKDNILKADEIKCDLPAQPRA